MKKEIGKDKVTELRTSGLLINFLKLFDLNLNFGKDPRIVVNKNDEQVGYSRILADIKKPSFFRAQTEIILPYGGIRIQQDINSNSLFFQINRNGSKKIVGVLSGFAVYEEFKIDGFSLSVKNHEEDTEELSLLSQGKAFYYRNYIEDETIEFRTRPNKFDSEVDTSLKTVHQNKKEKQEVEIQVAKNCQCLYEVNCANYTKQEFPNLSGLTEEINNKGLPIYEKFYSAIAEVDPFFYDRLENILNSYEYNDKNIVTEGIRQFLLPEITEDQTKCLLGKKLIKKLDRK